MSAVFYRMPTVSTVLTQSHYFRREGRGQNKIKNGVFRFYYNRMAAPLLSSKAARELDNMNGAGGSSARVADALAAADAGGADVVWAMVPTACGKWRHVVNTKIRKGV